MRVGLEAERRAAEPRPPAPRAGLDRAAVLALQRGAGNRAVAELMRLAPLPGPASTRPVPAVRPAAPEAAPPIPTSVQRAGPALSALYELGAAAQRRERPGAPAPPARGVPAAAAEAVAGLGTGEPVAEDARIAFELAYGHRLDPVRLHRGPVAARAADALGARAVTLGDHVLLGEGTDPASAEGRFVLGHELAHVVQSRRTPAAGAGRVSDPFQASEREATAASAAALSGRPTELREAAGEDPQPFVWWLLALLGLGIGGAVALTASATGHGVDANAKEGVREQRDTGEDVVAWIPIAGSVQDIWQAESELQLALGVGFLAFDVATLGGTGTVLRALARVPRAALRVLAADEAKVAGKELLGTAARELAERGGAVSAATATDEIGRALATDGAMVFAMEGGHAVLYANRAGQVIKVHGGPLMVRFAVRELGEDAAARAVAGTASEQGPVTAYAIVTQGAPLTLEALERLPTGASGSLQAVARNLFGGPTSCGIIQGAAMEAGGLTADAIARLLPEGGASGRYLPVTLVDRWIETGAGKLVEGGAATLVYGATGTVTQAVVGIAQIGLRVLAPPGLRQAAEAAAPAADGGMSAALSGLDAAAPEAPDAALAATFERAAAAIVEQYGPAPAGGALDAIREHLPDHVPGWLAMSRPARAGLRSFLRRAGMTATAVEAILADQTP